MDSTTVTTMSSRAHTRSFQHLPNLPAAVIPKIDLGIQRTDLATMLQIRPNHTTFRKFGYVVQDKACQTDEEHIVDLKFAIEMLQILTQDTGKLRRDLNFAQSVLKANYEKQISDRATELYCRVNERMTELENRHKMKVETVRKCYQTQLDDAIQKISGDYEAYYEELLSGKTGRHDLIIKDLRKQLYNKDVILRQLTAKIEELQETIQNLLENQNKEPTPTITPEEVKKMEDEIKELKRSVDLLESDLATQFDKNDMLNRENMLLNKQLDEEKKKYAQIQNDMEAYKLKAKEDQERAARMAEKQLASLEKEMKEKMDNAERNAARKAQEQAEMLRLQDQAKFQEEMEKRKSMEDKLRADAEARPKTVTSVIGDDELLQKLRVMERTEKKQKEEIERLTKELEKTNKIWEIKMAVLRKNYLALKDEFYIRHSLQKQAASLHQASVGYVSTGNLKLPALQTKELKPQHRNYITDSDRTDTSSETNRNSTKSLNTVMYTSTPPPSPTQPRQSNSSRMVHFDTSSTTYPTSSSNPTDSNRTDTTNAS